VLVISVIKPSFRSYLTSYDNLYYSKIRDIAIQFIKKGFKVNLMSFCKEEGDEEAINEIYKMIPQEYYSYIIQYNYSGNIDEALQIIGSSSFIIATRFHAMILGWLFEKPVVPIVYNEKMLNVMKDVNFKGIYSDFNNLVKLKPSELFQSMETNLIDVREQIKSSEAHFKELDKILLDKI